MEDEDDLGNPWLAIVIGIALLVLAWYLSTKFGADLHLHRKAAIANSGMGRKLLIGMTLIVGAFFIVRGAAKLRSDN